MVPRRAREESSWSARARAVAAALLCSSIACTTPGGHAPAPLARGIDAVDPLAVFDAVCELVAREFFDPDLGGLDWEELTAAQRPRAATAIDEDGLDGVLAPLLAELRTSHTRYLCASDPAFHVLADLFGLGPRFPVVYPGGEVSTEGIGILGEPFDEGYLVLGVLHGSPARRAGLLVGDVILQADGTRFAPVTSFQGKSGRPVELRVRRRPGDPPVTLSVVPVRGSPRDRLLAAAEASMEVRSVGERRVAYARIWSYADPRVHEALVDALSRGPLAQADALVLDLRGGWGGANPAYLDLFHTRVPHLEMIDRAGQVTVFDGRWRRPVVLLVGGGTRSGKEVLAHAFRRHGIGPVVGERTAGAVTGGRAFAVGPGSLLYLAVRDVRVDGQRLEGMGVEPDVHVPWTRAYSAGVDPQRMRALALAAELAGAPR